MITDVFNLIGKCVVSGNVRRSAEIAFGEADDETFLDLKDYEKNPERIIKNAVKGMLPKNTLGRKQGLKLKVYAGAEHPHMAQKPTEIKMEG